MSPASREHQAMKQGEILFVLGPARSGTTYLNNFLDRWFGYGMGPEGTFVAPFHKRLARYGDLREDHNLTRLLQDIAGCQMLEILRRRPPANRIDVTPAAIRARLAEPSYAGVVYAVFQCLADLQGKERVGNKNPGYWNDLPLLESLFPDRAKYIAIIRDGRDVFLSLQGMPWGGHSAYAAARRWRAAIERIEAFQRQSPGKLLLLRYEDLLQEPGPAIAAMEDHLGFRLAPERRAQALKESLANPKRHNSHKWKSALSAPERRVFEALAGDKLAAYGYDTLATRPRLGLFERAGFQLGEAWRLGDQPLSLAQQAARRHPAKAG